MTAVFPGAIPTYTNPTASMTLGSADHVALHSNVQDDVVQLATKLGRTGSVPAANQVLRGTGAGTSAFGAIQTGDLAAGAISQRVIAAPTGSQTTTSTTVVTMTGGSVNMTCFGGIVVLLAIGTVSHNQAGGIVQMDVAVDGVSQGSYTVLQIPTVGGFMSFAICISGSVAAGSRAFALRWFVNSGTVTLNAGTLHVIELKK